ncbi:hypothetical protein ACQP2F_14175 [Actinoplanes sp. CA-030573]|uniref:hypothetical protein n=1 Tax=Actinoplanes sp. CA-030573 TaxID=3239898 RepID=UPI003D949DC3
MPSSYEHAHRQPVTVVITEGNTLTIRLTEKINIAAAPGLRDHPGGDPRRPEQDLCRRATFEVQMQTHPSARAVACFASASGSSAIERRDEVPTRPAAAW